MSKSLLLIHVVFATKYRKKALPIEEKELLYAYIHGIVRNKFDTPIMAMNGIDDHIHMLIDMNPSYSLADFVKGVKQSSSRWLSGHKSFPLFEGWAVGYYAVSVSPDSGHRVINYIRNQESHHSRHSLDNELQFLAAACGLNWHPDDLT